MSDDEGRSQEMYFSSYHWLSDQVVQKLLTASWILNIVILSAALVATVKFFPLIVSDTVIGVIFLGVGFHLAVETFVKNGYSPAQSVSDAVGTVMSIFALGYGAGVLGMFGAELNNILKTTLGGVQGGVMLGILVNLVYEGVKNRR